MDNILKKISTSLITGNDQLKTNFCAEYALNPADINVAIDGIGTLEFPLTTQKIEQLLSASSKAKFGLRNQTILDENVRSTQEIPIDKLHVSFNKNKFSNLLQKT